MDEWRPAEREKKRTRNKYIEHSFSSQLIAKLNFLRFFFFFFVASPKHLHEEELMHVSAGCRQEMLRLVYNVAEEASVKVVPVIQTYSRESRTRDVRGAECCIFYSGLLIKCWLLSKKEHLNCGLSRPPRGGTTRRETEHGGNLLLVLVEWVRINNVMTSLKNVGYDATRRCQFAAVFLHFNISLRILFVSQVMQWK